MESSLTDMVRNMGVLAILVFTVMLGMAVTIVVATLRRRPSILRSIAWTAPMLGVLAAAIGFMNAAQQVALGAEYDSGMWASATVESLMPLTIGLVLGVSAFWGLWVITRNQPSQ